MFTLFSFPYKENAKPVHLQANIGDVRSTGSGYLAKCFDVVKLPALPHLMPNTLDDLVCFLQEIQTYTTGILYIVRI